jgi:2-iminobutanoate/2-iminopropanoate deaminase
MEKKVFRAEYGGGLGTRPYARAIRVGNFVFMAGMAGVDHKTGELVLGKWENPEETVRAQTRMACEKVKMTLEEAGTNIDNIVYMLVMVTKLENYGIICDEMRKFGLHIEDFPATLIEGGLYPRGSNVELEVIATVTDGK